ncbi:uncharacterized protein PHACADRAFT_263977 [Phanerochaete carnosa HHB-10118-sp]|uniref:Uncharacterized protein n=1 Tax=Phanerochaete carnosa (strain HHB-10118-sp) TaxID=650164 RepID=K5VVK1_PHACS|nr:uncharacterized protein PHACADRAFT_263977 [Phanerochaete carnosa HHB-10118-sp]EKM50609.1 hypothetical protein PHACADRAFT_263977 [Phanerochaete carnosa HHB-10118-sp]
MLGLRPALVSARCLRRSGAFRFSTRVSCLQRPPAFASPVVRAFSVYHPRLENGNEPGKKLGKVTETLHEDIYTIPNLLTISRILACPVLGYAIVQDNFVTATALLVYAGLTDLVCLFTFSLAPRNIAF